MPVTNPKPTGQESLALRAFAGLRTERPPFWLMRQAGRYLPEYRALRAKAADFLSFCYTPDLAVEATLQPIRRFGMDAAILFSDILVVPDALGAEVGFVEGEGPKLTPVRERSAVEALSDVHLLERLAPVYETVSELRRQLSAETALIGFSGAPWTLACYMVEGAGSRDFQQTRALAYGEPALFATLIDLLTRSVTAHLDAQIRAGAQAVQLFDSWAGVLPEPQFERWCIEPTAAIVSGLRSRHPDVPVIAFPRGAGALYASFARQVPCQAVSLDTGIPVAWAVSTLRADRPLCLQGNLDPVALLAGGAAMMGEAERIVRILGTGPFVFNLGHGVLPQTDPGEVARLADGLKSMRLGVM